MDKINIELNSKLMRGLVSKLIARSIKKQYGCKVDIQLNGLDFSSINGETNLHIDIEAKLDSDDFKQIVKSINEDQNLI